jgi:hypothetical protein
MKSFRRDAAAVLAAYLAHFDRTDADPSDDHTAATALTPEEHQQCRRDYAQCAA